MDNVQVSTHPKSRMSKAEDFAREQQARIGAISQRLHDVKSRLESLQIGTQVHNGGTRTVSLAVIDLEEIATLVREIGYVGAQGNPS